MNIEKEKGLLLIQNMIHNIKQTNYSEKKNQLYKKKTYQTSFLQSQIKQILG